MTSIGEGEGSGFTSDELRVRPARLIFFVYVEQRGVFFHGGNSRVQPLFLAHSDACSLHILFRPVTFVPLLSESGRIPMECTTKPPPPPHFHSYFLLVVMTITYSPIPSLFPFFLRWGQWMFLLFRQLQMPSQLTRMRQGPALTPICPLRCRPSSLPPTP